jgi:hypothetical protein
LTSSEACAFVIMLVVIALAISTIAVLTWKLGWIINPSFDKWFEFASPGPVLGPFSGCHRVQRVISCAVFPPRDNYSMTQQSAGRSQLPDPSITRPPDRPTLGGSLGLWHNNSLACRGTACISFLAVYKEGKAPSILSFYVKSTFWTFFSLSKQQ